MISSRWFVRFKPIDQPALRLFCFPFAGGSASEFAGWAKVLRGDVEVVAVQPPSRGCRLAEQPLSSMRSMTDELVALMGRIEPTVPYVLFGHSLGARLCYAVACRLQTLGYCAPEAVILSASRAAHLPDRYAAIHNLDSEAFLAELAKLNGTAPAVLQNQELMALLLPGLRADFQISHEYQALNRQKLHCPMYILTGKDDRVVDKSESQAWQELAGGPYRAQEFCGGHFFIRECLVEVLGYINDIAMDILNRKPGQACRYGLNRENVADSG